MKSSTCLVNGLIIGVLALLLGGIGFSIGSSTIGEYNPPWAHYSIQSPPKEIVNIAHVEIASTLTDPTGDTIFVKAKDGQVYANTVFQNEWSVVDPIPAWDNKSPYNCTGDYLAPSGSHMWDRPPVDKDIVDSYGALFERPISTIVRCYVLFDDGSLEVWVHSGDAIGLLAGVFTKIAYASIGVIIGMIIGILIVRFRRRAASLITWSQLTPRAPDGWESSHFQAVFVAQAGSVKIALPHPSRQQVTPTVGLPSRCVENKI